MSAGALLQFDTDARRALLTAAAKTRGDVDAVLRSLAAEIAMGIQELDTIIELHGLDQQAWDRIKNLPRFHAFLSEAMIQWQATSSAKTRITAKMEAMLEDSLPDMYAALLKGDELTPSKVKFVEAIMRGTGIGEVASKNTAAGVSINISLDATRQTRQVIIEHDPGTDEA